MTAGDEVGDPFDEVLITTLENLVELVKMAQ